LVVVVVEPMATLPQLEVLEVLEVVVAMVGVEVLAPLGRATQEGHISIRLTTEQVVVVEREVSVVTVPQIEAEMGALI
jgi:hypothetical protein